jgi:Fe-S cluster biogenesis protein NfuA
VTAAPSTRRSECEAQIARIDELVQQLEEVRDPVVRATGRELMQATMALHGAALERIVELAGGSGDSGQALLEELARDELVASVLVLYGLHPVDLETRVGEALEKARPYLHSHGGNVELIGIDYGEVVRVRLEGSCHGCPASSLTLRTAIESAVKEAAPEITSIVVVGEEAA